MKKVMIVIIVIVVAIVAVKMPDMVQSSIPSIYYVTPNQKTYANSVLCNGTVQPEHVGEVYLSNVGRVESIFVNVGDSVIAGELIAKVKQAPIPVDDLMISSLRENDLSKGQTADFATIASLYALSSQMGGALTDYTDLARLLALVQEEQTSTVQSDLIEDADEGIYAPISGIVTGIAISENAYAFPGLPVITVSSCDSFKVLGTVSEADIASISIGDSARIQCVGYSKRYYHGTVTRIYPSARKVLNGTATETVVDIEIALADADQNLKPGFSAAVEISGGGNQILTTVPYESIRQDENNDEYVYVYEDGAIRKVLVITGQELTNEVEVLSGLTQDSIVVYNPSNIVREGQVIQLKGRADVD